MQNDTAALDRRNPLWGFWAIVLAGLSLSIGWGIRGNYGHAMGAMFPGAIAAIAVCVLSARGDWRERVAYFACFGALGWAFGGSISYMQVLAYTHSGHALSQFYGYWGLFLIGFLWAALGGAGTALPAVLDRKTICEMFQPLSLLLALWAVLYFVEQPLVRMAQSQFETSYSLLHGSHRHESVLYWFDSVWISAFVALVGILAFDLIDRRFSASLLLPVFAAVGGGLGQLAEMALLHAGWGDAVRRRLVHLQGDPAAFNPNSLITNLPEFVLIHSRYIGAGIGVAVGIGAYFALFGKFRKGSSLFLHMTLGWFAGFLLLPVLLDLHMTPPRGDDWAGILGLFAGLIVYLVRHKLWPIAAVSLVCGTIGGIGLSCVACIQSLLRSFGNPNLAPGLAESWSVWQTGSIASFAYPPSFLTNNQPANTWQFWQQANWHSYLEQKYGFVNGVALIAAMALLVRRVGPLDNSAKRERWTEIVAVTLTVPVLLYVNLVQNVADWTAHQPAAVPHDLRTPLIGLPLSTLGWFNILFGTASIAFVMLLSIHTRRRLAVLEMNWIGRGQLFFLVLMWVFVIGNFAKALPHFVERRLLTEGVITLNAVFATMMVLLVPRSRESIPESADQNFRRLTALSLAAALACAVLIPPLATVCTRMIYGNAPVSFGKQEPQMRFGPRATWKHRPLLKGSEHR